MSEHNQADSDRPPSSDGPSLPALRQELNAWREVGEEIGRVISLLSKEQYEDLFPDWFGPRLFDLQVKAERDVDQVVVAGIPAPPRPEEDPPR